MDECNNNKNCIYYMILYNISISCCKNEAILNRNLVLVKILKKYSDINSKL